MFIAFSFIFQGAGGRGQPASRDAEMARQSCRRIQVTPYAAMFIVDIRHAGYSWNR